MSAERQARGGVLIAGGGFAGAYVARLLGTRGATIVSPESFMLYTPILPEAASGTLEPRHVVVPLRQMCPHAELLLGRMTALDQERRVVGVETAEADSVEVEYEQLVVALGAVARALPIPGLAEHALGFKDPAGSATHLSFVFVGAGYAGVEALAELSDLVGDALRYYPRLRAAPQRWVLVDAASKILPEIPTRLGDYAARELARRGVEINVGTTLESVSAGEAVLSDGQRIPTHTVVWTAGVTANPLFGELGDGAAVPNLATPGRFDPPTCQHALRQARRLARNLQGEPQPYSYKMLGQVATLGRYKGIADVLGLRFRGFPGWFITRSYHLLQLPLFTRKLRVVIDWTPA